MRRHHVDGRGLRVAAGVRRVESVDVGEQEQPVGLHHRRHVCGESVIVSHTQVVHCGGVVFVDNWNDAELEELLKVVLVLHIVRLSRNVLSREQNLCERVQRALVSSMPLSPSRARARAREAAHLSNGLAQVAEKVVVHAHQTGLSDGGDRLFDRDNSRLLLHVETLAADLQWERLVSADDGDGKQTYRHGTRGDKNDAVALAAETSEKFC